MRAGPASARIALQFVLNYEEGGENCVLHGDAASETFLSEIVGAQAFAARHLSMESMYEYGSRAGAWRILREFERRGLPLTVFGVSMALQRHPELTQAFVDLGHEIACHGWRWIHHQHMAEAEERAHIETGTRIIRELTGGAWPLGWYTGRDSPNTKRLVADHGGYEYDSDYYGDDLPFWMPVEKSDGTTLQRLIVPVHARHQRHALRVAAGLQHRRPLLRLPEGRVRRAVRRRRPRPPKMLSIGMHCRLLGRPGAVSRAAALPRPRAGARPGLDRAPDRHRAPLDAGPPGPRGRAGLSFASTGIPPPISRKDPS